ncbi:MAG: ATP-binding protein [Burkholderiales bacterium]
MEAIGQLTGGIAHDFNNMLASIYGSIQLMQRKLKSGKLEGFDILLERASTSTQRASSLTQRLLAFARRQSLDIRRVDVVKLIESLEDMFVRTLGPKVALTIELGTDLWSAKIDASQLESALLNLVINARDAMADGGQLNIAVENVEIDADYAATQAELNAGEYVAIRVTDDGAGMPASVIARAFEPFFTTKPIGQGTGLGLSMVYGFVKQAGGHIRIHSQPGKGTSVSLFLPRDMSDGASAEPAAELPQTPYVRTGKTVLVVEDEESVRSVIIAVLQDLGYRYIEAGDAKAALAVIDTPTPIDLLVSDVGLPGMNGRQLAEIATARRPGLKVLFVTGYAEQAAVRHGFLTAGMQMITKPFVIDELANRVRSILAEPAPKPPALPPPV